MKKVLIIGAGPAGLTAAYELLHRAKGEYEVIVFEESSDMGGISGLSITRETVWIWVDTASFPKYPG